MSDIYALKQLVGKTIRAVGDDPLSEYLALHFTDGSSVVWKAREAYGEAFLGKVDAQELPAWELERCGFIDREECERRQAEADQREAEAREAAERQELERLLRKYGRQARTISHE